MNTPTQQPYYKRSIFSEDPAPFTGDVLGDRAAIAARLTAYLPGFQDGVVFAIDGPWGSGKTWFGKHWQRQLVADGYLSARLDAFASDYSDDPFILIAAEINRLAKGKDFGIQKNLKKTAIAVGKAIGPMIAKAAISIVINKTIGEEGADSLKDIIDTARDDVDDAADRYLKDRFADHDRQQQSVDAYRKALTDFTSEQGKPVVFFIDELDRCRPDIAVRLVERIKHFFDVPNLIFVLLLNRVQLEEAIRGLYGPNIDANAYLAKFVQFSVTLPTTSLWGGEGVNIAHSYCLEIARRHTYPSNDMTLNFIRSLSALAPVFRLSLRDLERAFTLLGFSGIRNPGPMALLAYLIALKISEPEQFRQIAAANHNAHQTALERLTNARAKNGDDEYFGALCELHRFYSGKLDTIPQGPQMQLRRLIGSSRQNEVVGEAIDRIVVQIDLLVSN